MLECTNQSGIRVDSYAVHWGQDDVYFGPSDIMTPVIDPSFSWSKCTSEAVVESQPSWTSLACDTTVDCPTGHKCFTFGSNLGGFCSKQANVTAQLDAPNQHRFPAFTVFVSVVTSFLLVVRTCLDRAGRMIDT